MMRWFRRHVAPQAGPAFHAVGYPKVGNTWLRLTLGLYLQARYGLAELPLMDVGDEPALRAAGARAIGEFSHRPLEWDAQTAADLDVAGVVQPFAGTRVIFLTRYPLDALVSLFMQMRHRTTHPFSGTIESFVTDPVLGLDKLLRFHQIWDASRGMTDAWLLWRYEDALARPRDEFEKVLRFLGEPVEPGAVATAIEQSSFSQLRAMELSQRQPVYKSSQLPIFGTGDRANPNALHTRRGQAGGYRSELPAALCRELEARITAEMPALFGYAAPPEGPQ